MAVENNVLIKSNSNLTKTSNTVKPQQYKVNPNGVDKTPDKDTVQLSTAKKVGIGAGIAAAAVGLFFLMRGKKPPKNIVKQTEQVISHEPPKMHLTEDAKKIYDDVASKLHKKTATTSETIEHNLAPKTKKGEWNSADRKEYYTQLEKESAEKAAKDAEVKAAREAEIKAAKDAEVKAAREAEIKAAKEAEAKVAKTPKVTIKGDTTIIEEPFVTTGKDGQIHELSLTKKETISDGPFGKRKEYVYTIYDSNGKRIAECDGTIETRDGKKVLNGHGIQSFKKGLGLGTKLKEVIKQAAKENGCESINIEAAYGSHMFHNKMGYKVNYDNNVFGNEVSGGRGVLKRIKINKKLPEFQDRINEVLASDNTKAEDVNNLLDEILSFANSKGLNSKDIAIQGISIPMTYKL
ncbi:MAG: hypothetical protein ACI4S3_06945 [Candidatus Gastranaerophilaceae bacterium]